MLTKCHTCDQEYEIKSDWINQIGECEICNNEFIISEFNSKLIDPLIVNDFVNEFFYRAVSVQQQKESESGAMSWINTFVIFYKDFLPDNITETDISYIFKKVINYNGNTISYIVKCFELGNYAIELISGYKSQAEKVHLIKQREQWEKSLLKTKNPIYVDEIKDTIKSINKRIITLVN